MRKICGQKSVEKIQEITEEPSQVPRNFFFALFKIIIAHCVVMYAYSTYKLTIDGQAKEASYFFLNNKKCNISFSLVPCHKI